MDISETGKTISILDQNVSMHFSPCHSDLDTNISNFSTVESSENHRHADIFLKWSIKCGNEPCKY